MDQANRRLAGIEFFTVAPSKYLGPYVACHLAIRHGINLHLQPTPGTGTTAAIELPPGLISSSSNARADIRPALSDRP